MSKNILYIIFVFSTLFSNSSNSKTIDLCKDPNGLTLNETDGELMKNSQLSFNYECNYDFWYLGRRTRGLTFNARRSKYQNSSFTTINFFSNRDLLSNYHHYLAELSKITLHDKNGNLITNRKFKVSFYLKSIGHTKEYLPPGAEIRSDLDLRENKHDIIITLGDDGQIILFAFPRQHISPYHPERGEDPAFKEDDLEDFIEKNKITIDYAYHNRRMNILNGLTNTDISDTLNENYSIEVEVTDLGPSSKKLTDEKTALNLAVKKLEILEDQIILNAKNITNLLQGQEEINNNMPSYKVSKELLNFLEEGRKYSEQRNQLKRERDHLAKSISIRTKLDSLAIVGEKIHKTAVISDFMQTNHEGYKLPSYYANSKGLWVKVIQHRSIFGITGALDINISDSKYNQKYQELMKE